MVKKNSLPGNCYSFTFRDDAFRLRKKCGKPGEFRGTG